MPVAAADLLSEGSRRAVYHANRAASYLARASGGPLRAGEGNVEGRWGTAAREEADGRRREGEQGGKGGGGVKGSGGGREEEGKGIHASPSSGFR